MIDQCRKELNNLRRSYDVRLGQYSQLEKDRLQLIDELDTAHSTLADAELIRVLLQDTSREARESARARLEYVVTSVLQYVFGDNFSFEIELDNSRGKPEADCFVKTVDENGVVTRVHPENSNGGGVLDIISLALRYAVMKVHTNPKLNGPVILDEPGKHVDEENAVRLGEFLKQLCVSFDQQFIVSTHQRAVADVADKKFQFDVKGGKTVVETA